jgi:hypothetical protein
VYVTKAEKINETDVFEMAGARGGCGAKQDMLNQFGFPIQLFPKDAVGFCSPVVWSLD